MKRILFFLLVLSIYTGCSKDKDETVQSVDCVKLKQAMANDEVAVVKELINELATNIDAPAALNQYDADKFLIDELVKRLKTNCGINTEAICYGCINTFPAQSEIRLKFSAGVVSMEKTLDLIITDDGGVRCVNMHD